MADTSIVDRSGKGSALTSAEYDQNINSACGVVEEQTGTSYTILYSDQNKTIEFNNASAIAVTLPDAATLQALLDTSQFKVTLKQTGAGNVTITGSSGQIDGATAITLSDSGSITLQTDAAGTAWNILNSKELFHNGVKRLQSASGGVVVLYSDGSTDSENRYLRLDHADGTPRARIGHVGSGILQLENLVHGSAVQITGEDAGGSERALLLADPDADFKLYYAGTSVAATLGAASGGLQANNTLTGGGFERVLTASDLQLITVATVTSGLVTGPISEQDVPLDGIQYAATNLDRSGNTIVNNTGVTRIAKVTLCVHIQPSVAQDWSFHIEKGSTVQGEIMTGNYDTGGGMVVIERIVSMANGESVRGRFDDTSGTNNLTFGTGGTLSVHLIA